MRETQLVKYLTRFVDETFTTFISIGFMMEAYKVCFNNLRCLTDVFDSQQVSAKGCYFSSHYTWHLAYMQGVSSLYSPASSYPIETAFLSFLLAAGTYATAKILTQVANLMSSQNPWLISFYVCFEMDYVLNE